MFLKILRSLKKLKMKLEKLIPLRVKWYPDTEKNLFTSQINSRKP